MPKPGLDGQKRVELLKESFKNQIKVTRRNVISGQEVCERDGSDGVRQRWEAAAAQGQMSGWQQLSVKIIQIRNIHTYVEESGPVQQTPLNSIRSNDTSPDPTIRTQAHFLLRAYVHPCRPNISLSLSLPFAFPGLTIGL
ncbi:uncharacterized protein Dyak_GE28091 [Drosophila yakuba]|uniref:Uncharacterized protein n=1 Tax=Drosophila yakuba TaxID=7245 RepID=A0A0R1E3X3_DROYA|nr:uncharacterized protein Dyak_GE28091 [Drosophila yakuba]